MPSSQDILTPRELEIINLMAAEYSNKDISGHLRISVGTVESHRKNIFYKLGTKNMAGAIHKAYQMRILTLD